VVAGMWVGCGFAGACGGCRLLLVGVQTAAVLQPQEMHLVIEGCARLAVTMESEGVPAHRSDHTCTPTRKHTQT